MRVLAIDPGSKLGWCTDSTGRLEWGTEDFRIRAGESSGNRWRRFGMWLTGMSVTIGHYGSDAKLPDSTLVDLIVYERAVFMPKARAAAEIAAGFTTRLEEHCERHGIALEPVAVQTLKAYALPRVLRKKGDPKMDRSKAAMISAAWLRLDHMLDRTRACESLGKPIQELDGTPLQSVTQEDVGRLLTEHEADALFLYWMVKERHR